MADINAPFEQDILELTQRKRMPNGHHHREADYLGRTIEAAERISHPRRIWIATHRLKSDCSDNALPGKSANRPPSLADADATAPVGSNDAELFA